MRTVAPRTGSSLAVLTLLAAYGCSGGAHASGPAIEISPYKPAGPAGAVLRAGSGPKCTTRIRYRGRNGGVAFDVVRLDADGNELSRRSIASLGDLAANTDLICHCDSRRLTVDGEEHRYLDVRAAIDGRGSAISLTYDLEGFRPKSGGGSSEPSTVLEMQNQPGQECQLLRVQVREIP